MTAPLYRCWVCYDKDPVGDLIESPCACKGTSKYVHAKCLRRWIRVSMGNSALQRTFAPRCSQCRAEYKLDTLKRTQSGEDYEGNPWPAGKGPRWRSMSQEHRLIFAAWLVHPLLHFLLVTLTGTMIAFFLAQFAFTRVREGPGKILAFGPVLVFRFDNNSTTMSPYSSKAEETLSSFFERYYQYFFGATSFPISESLESWWENSVWGVYQRWSSCWSYINMFMFAMTVARRTLASLSMFRREFNSLLAAVLCGGLPNNYVYMLHDAVGIFCAVRNLIVVYVLPLLRPFALLFDPIFMITMTVFSSFMLTFCFLVTCVWAARDLW